MNQFSVQNVRQFTCKRTAKWGGVPRRLNADKIFPSLKVKFMQVHHWTLMKCIHLQQWTEALFSWYILTRQPDQISKVLLNIVITIRRKSFGEGPLHRAAKGGYLSFLTRQRPSVTGCVPRYRASNSLTIWRTSGSSKAILFSKRTSDFFSMCWKVLCSFLHLTWNFWVWFDFVLWFIGISWKATSGNIVAQVNKWGTSVWMENIHTGEEKSWALAVGTEIQWGRIDRGNKESHFAPGEKLTENCDPFEKGMGFLLTGGNHGS